MFLTQATPEAGQEAVQSWEKLLGVMLVLAAQLVQATQTVVRASLPYPCFLPHLLVCLGGPLAPSSRPLSAICMMCSFPLLARHLRCATVLNSH